MSVAENSAEDNVALALDALKVAAVIGDVLGGQESESTLYFLDGREGDVLEHAGEQSSSVDILKRAEAVDGSQSTVIGYLKTTNDCGELGESQVGKLVVADKGEGSSNPGQVGGGQGLEEVAVESQGLIDSAEGWNRDAGCVAHRNGASPQEIRKIDLQLHSVGGDGQLSLDVVQGHVNLGQVEVVCNGDGISLEKVNSLQSREASVRNDERRRHVDGGVGGLEARQGIPHDRVCGTEHGHVKSSESGQAVEGKVLANRRQSRGGQRTEPGTIADGFKAAGDDLNAGDSDVSSDAGGKGEATREGGAGGESRSIASVLDGEGGRSSARSGRLGSDVASDGQRRHDVSERSHCLSSLHKSVCKTAAKWRRRKWK